MSAAGPVRSAVRTRSDWETPPELFGALDREFRFTLDAAATHETRKCERYLTPDEDALKAHIFDQVVWCNPPYGRGLEDWCASFAMWALNGCTVVALLPANTDTEWFRMVWFWSHEIRLLYRRVNFVGSSGGNTGGSLVAVYRPSPLRMLPGEGEPRFSASNFNPPRVTLWDWRGDA